MKTRRELLALGALALAIGAQAVTAAPGGRGRGRGPKPKKVVLNGTVTSVSEPGFTMHKNGRGRDGQDFSVLTTEDTLYRRTDGAEASFADIVSGARLQVKGVRELDGSITAARVLVKVPEPEED